MYKFNISTESIDDRSAYKLSFAIESLLSAHPQMDKLLVGLSGGPDSTALLHCLLRLKKRLNFTLGVAHIDHRWRKESADEALALRLEMEKIDLPFHLKVLNPRELEGNLEQCCRNERLRFYASLCKTEGYKGVLLGHHQDDLAETVLKRIFEGASLQGLCAMEPVTYIEGLCVLRPWIHLPKEEIYTYLEENKLSFFDDPTNGDAKFLRGRMRRHLFPLVEAQFGKSIKPCLSRLSRESSELNDYMRHALERKGAQVVTGPFGECLDLSKGAHPFEMRWILRKWLKEQCVEASHAIIEEILDLVRSKKADRKVHTRGKHLQVDRGKIFIVPEVLPALHPPLLIRHGLHTWGNWEVFVGDTIEHKTSKGWQASWKGVLSTTLPHGEYYLGFYRDVVDAKDIKTLHKMWTNAKVPAFLRALIPVITSKGCLQKEFLLESKKEESPSPLFVSIKYSS